VHGVDGRDICRSASANSQPTAAIGSSRKMQAQRLDQQRGRQLLRDQEATRLRIAQFLPHPLQAPSAALPCPLPCGCARSAAAIAEATGSLAAPSRAKCRQG